MQIDERRHGAITILRPRGPVAGEDAKDFAERFARTTRETLGRVVLDASAIAYVDSAALEAICDVSEKIGEMGRTLKLCGVNETVREVLDLTGLAGDLEQFEDVNDAVRSFL